MLISVRALAQKHLPQQQHLPLFSRWEFNSRISSSLHTFQGWRDKQPPVCFHRARQNCWFCREESQMSSSGPSPLYTHTNCDQIVRRILVFSNLGHGVVIFVEIIFSGISHDCIAAQNYLMKNDTSECFGPKVGSHLNNPLSNSGDHWYNKMQQRESYAYGFVHIFSRRGVMLNIYTSALLIMPSWLSLSR